MKKRIIVLVAIGILALAGCRQLAGCKGDKQKAIRRFGTLEVSVEFDGEYFIVANLDSVTWYDSVFSVNGEPRTITGKEYMMRTREVTRKRSRKKYRADRFRTTVYTEGTHRGFFRSFMERSIFSCRYAQGTHLDSTEVAPESFYINVSDKYGRHFDWWGDFPVLGRSSE